MNSEKPYERFMMSGAGSLTNAELLAIILRTGTKGVSAVIVREKVHKARRFDCAQDIAGYYMEEMRHLQTEATVVLHLDSKMNFLGEDTLTIGTVNGSLLSPREIFIRALERKAVQIVLIHNHPSGDPSPSGEDISVTQLIREAGEILGIRLCDHIIIGDLCYCSLREMGVLSYETAKP